MGGNPYLTWLRYLEWARDRRVVDPRSIGFYRDITQRHGVGIRVDGRSGVMIHRDFPSPFGLFADGYNPRERVLKPGEALIRFKKTTPEFYDELETREIERQKSQSSKLASERERS